MFTDPGALWDYYDKPREDAGFATLVDARTQVANPEQINDGDDTAPSKRIIRVIPQYKNEKATAGPYVANKIGLPRLRRECPHFNQWMCRLETLGAHK